MTAQTDTIDPAERTHHTTQERVFKLFGNNLLCHKNYCLYQPFPPLCNHSGIIDRLMGKESDWSEHQRSGFHHYTCSRCEYKYNFIKK